MFAGRTFVEYSLSLIYAAQLKGIKSDFRSVAFDAGFFDSHSAGFIGCFQCILFLVTLGPEWDSPI